MKDTNLQKKSTESGNTFFTALVFVFVLVGTLRICCNKTLHEAKLTGIFIQETQGYYLLENLMALARDYAYQITQNPREPNLFLSASSYRKKDKTYQNSQGEENAWVIDFNGSLSREQIVPDDFPLQIAENGWDIKGGPIFWQDKKKDSNDERWLSEVVMVGSLNLTNSLIPDWTIRMAQTMEIERNPLCDFQLYSEGDTSMTPNISGAADSNWRMFFNGPIQINGNVRFPQKMGYGSSVTEMYHRLNVAGKGFGSDYIKISMPLKYHMQDNGDFYDTFTNPYTVGSVRYYLKFSTINKNYIPSVSAIQQFYPFGYQSIEQRFFNVFHGNFTTRSRIYRPCGFDPLSYWGWWDSVTPYQSSPTAGNEVSKDLLTLDLCLGMHNLAKTSSWCGHLLFSKKFTDYNPFTHINALRGLNNYQITEKARLVETQKVINMPSLECLMMLKDKSDVPSGLYVANNVPYTTYAYDTYFPAKYDNFYLSRYMSLKSKNLTIIDPLVFSKNTTSSDYKYYFDSNDNPAASSPNIEDGNRYQCVKNNRLAWDSVTRTSISGLENIFKLTSDLTPSGPTNRTCPPHKIIDKYSYWEEAANQTRVKMGATYNFIYDRNRAKWIQLLDFDVGALKNAIGSTISSSDWDAMNHTVIFNASWQGSDRRACRNYTYPTYDIRYNYISNRTSFFNTYTDGLSYTYPSSNEPVIDVGVRIINAQELPAGGLTIFCPYPLYLQGNFNTTNIKPKACIITDSLTVLSDKVNNPDSKEEFTINGKSYTYNYWLDWRSSMDFWASRLVTGIQDFALGRFRPTIYAHIMTGRTHPHYWLTDNKNVLNPDLGIHDAIRTLEYFQNNLTIYGSILLPYYCQEQWEPPINFCHYGRTPLSYAPIDWWLGDSYSGTQWKSMRTAPGIPFYHRINRGRKTQAIGATIYNTIIGDTLYAKDWDDTSNFSAYHSALPNFLKYETNP